MEHGFPPGTEIAKARFTGRLACGHYIRRGQQIGRVTVRDGWRCLECLLAAGRRTRPTHSGGSAGTGGRA